MSRFSFPRTNCFPRTNRMAVLSHRRLRVAALAIVSAGASIATVGAAPSMAATKVGSSCSKAGATSVNGSQELVCQNVAAPGKRVKLRWAARPKTTTPTTSASSTPASSVNTVASSTPKATAKLTVYSGRTYGIEDVYKRFTRETGIELDVVTGADPANRARLETEGTNSPADVYLTVDIASLHRAAQLNLLAPIDSASLRTAVPSAYRDTKNRWFGLTKRARVIYVNTKNVKESDIPKTYEAVANSKWSGRVCSRPSSHVYTLSLAANLIAAYGSRGPAILDGIAHNTKAENFIDSDTRIIETVNAGGCDVGIANTYYWFRPGLQKDNVRMIMPNQADGERGVHVNVSGAGVVATSRNKANAQKFIEWLATDGASDFANGNAEFPVNPTTAIRPEVKEIATFKGDEGRIEDYARMQPAALIILAESGWR